MPETPQRGMPAAALLMPLSCLLLSCSLILDTEPKPADGLTDPAGEQDMAEQEKDGRIDVPETVEADPVPETGDPAGDPAADETAGDPDLADAMDAPDEAETEPAVICGLESIFEIHEGWETALAPSISPGHPEFAVAWVEKIGDAQYDINLTRIRLSGSTSVNEHSITSVESLSSLPHLSWTGSTYGVIWTDDQDGDNNIYFSIVTQEGELIVDSMKVTATTGISSSRSIVWNGPDPAEYAVAWADRTDDPQQIFLARISDEGSVIRSDFPITTHGAEGSRGARMAWTDSEIGMAWTRGSSPDEEIFFARVTAGGTVIDSEVRITDVPGSSRNPDIAWTGSEFAVAWADDRDGRYEIYLNGISEGGVPSGSETRITNAAGDSIDPQIVWNGSELGIAWNDARHVNEEIYFARISASGEKLGDEFRLTEDSVKSHMPSLTWSGSQYGLAWQNNDSPNILQVGLVVCEAE